MKKLLWVLVVLALGYGGWRWYKAKRVSKAPEYSQTTVVRGDLSVGVQATGSVQPQNRLEVRPSLAGRVEEMLVREGDYVKRGQVLAWLSSTERAALVDAARARGPEALARWESLYKAAPLLAPISGQVISRDTEPGQSISQADKVVVLSNRLIVKAQVDETDIAKVRQGQNAEIKLDAYAREKVPAKVGHIAYEARTVNNVTMYDIDVLPLKVPGFMRSGMTANVAFTTDEREDVLLLPLEAVTRKKREAFVNVPGPGKDGMAKPVSLSVQVGLDDGIQVEVIGGLKEGDMVLVLTSALPQAESAGGNPFMVKQPRVPRSGGGSRGTH
jgi:macrolide-specific efflux system membrane fusion protein